MNEINKLNKKKTLLQYDYSKNRKTTIVNDDIEFDIFIRDNSTI